MTGQMWRNDPRQDQKPGVVGDEMKVVPIGSFGRAHQLVPQVELARSRTPAQASDRSPPGQDQILQMLSDRTAVTQIMIAAEQMREEPFPLCPAHEPDLQWPQRSQ